MNAKSKDFYWLFINKTYTAKQTGPKRWDSTVTLKEEDWNNIFKSIRIICKENRLKEFHFKFIHRIIVTKKELLRFGIKTNSDCLYCGEQDSIDHTFLECQFTGNFIKSCLNWFNDVNNTHFNPTTVELLFGTHNKKSTVDKLFNYTLLFMCCYIYTRKLNEDVLLLPDFINKIRYRYSLEKFPPE